MWAPNEKRGLSEPVRLNRGKKKPPYQSVAGEETQAGEKKGRIAERTVQDQGEERRNR